MPSFSAQQQAFIRTYSALTGLHPGVVSAQVAAEEPVGATSGFHGTQDWLNVGITDSGPMGAGNPAWKDPVQAAKLAAAWATGRTSIPGFGHASPSIVNAIASTAGKSPQAQIAALQRSGWASSGYPNLPSLFNAYGRNAPGSAGLSAMPGASSAGGAGTSTVTVPGQFNQAAFNADQARYVAGSYLAKGTDPYAAGAPKTGLESSASSNPLISSGQLLTKAPDPTAAAYQTAAKTLTQVGGGQVTPHPAATGLTNTALKGVTQFDGKPVAKWIAPILAYATQHGWQGSITSGYRSYADQKRIYDSGVRPAAAPGTSNHEMTAFPGGAVDVSNAQQLSSILMKSPYASVLVYAGSKDPVHFSHPHNGSY